MKLMKPMRHQSLIQGFTLLEVLVALVILSLGLLGLAGLQLRSLQGSSDSFARSQAMILADSMADRMRANPIAVTEGSYRVAANNLPALPPYNCEDTFPAGENTCTPTEFAALDTADWANDLQTASVLPAGTGSITCNDIDAGDALPCSPNSVHTITLMWDEARTGVTGTGCGGGAADLQCLAIELKL